MSQIARLLQNGPLVPGAGMEAYMVPIADAYDVDPDDEPIDEPVAVQRMPSPEPEDEARTHFEDPDPFEEPSARDELAREWHQKLLGVEARFPFSFELRKNRPAAGADLGLWADPSYEPPQPRRRKRRQAFGYTQADIHSDIHRAAAIARLAACFVLRRPIRGEQALDPNIVITRGTTGVVVTFPGIIMSNTAYRYALQFMERSLPSLGAMDDAAIAASCVSVEVPSLPPNVDFQRAWQSERSFAADNLGVAVDMVDSAGPDGDCYTGDNDSAAMAAWLIINSTMYLSDDKVFCAMESEADIDVKSQYVDMEDGVDEKGRPKTHKVKQFKFMDYARTPGEHNFYDRCQEAITDWTRIGVRVQDDWVDQIELPPINQGRATRIFTHQPTSSSAVLAFNTFAVPRGGLTRILPVILDQGLRPEDINLDSIKSLREMLRVHAESTSENPEERDKLEAYLQKWMLWFILHFGRKMQHAPMLIGKHGAGKSSLGEMMVHLIGSRYARAVAGSKSLSDKFDEYKATNLLEILEEVMTDPAAAQILKANITELHTMIRKMNVAGAAAIACCNYMMTSNAAVGADGKPTVHIEKGERRFAAFACAMTLEHGYDQEWWDRFFAQLDDNRATSNTTIRLAHQVMAMLLTFEIPTVDFGHFRPMDTALKLSLEDSNTREYGGLVDLCANGYPSEEATGPLVMLHGLSQHAERIARAVKKALPPNTDIKLAYARRATPSGKKMWAKVQYGLRLVAMAIGGTQPDDERLEYNTWSFGRDGDTMHARKLCDRARSLAQRGQRAEALSAVGPYNVREFCKVYNACDGLGLKMSTIGVTGKLVWALLSMSTAREATHASLTGLWIRLLTEKPQIISNNTQWYGFYRINSAAWKKIKKQHRDDMPFEYVDVRGSFTPKKMPSATWTPKRDRVRCNIVWTGDIRKARTFLTQADVSVKWKCVCDHELRLTASPDAVCTCLADPTRHAPPIVVHQQPAGRDGTDVIDLDPVDDDLPADEASPVGWQWESEAQRRRRLGPGAAATDEDVEIPALADDPEFARRLAVAAINANV